MQLRPYQSEALSAVLREYEAGRSSTLIEMATGCGKTVIFSHIAKHYASRGRVLVIAHRSELIDQAARKIKAVTGRWPEIEMAEQRASSDSLSAAFGSPFVVSTIQTQSSGKEDKRMHRFNPEDFALLVIDECFPAGTPIGKRPIETIRVGDLVDSFNHATGRVERRPVTRTFRHKPASLVTVRFSGGRSFACTAGHPVYVPARHAYVPAALLSPGDRVLLRHEDDTLLTQADLSELRNRVCDRNRTAHLLGGMRAGAEVREEIATGTDALPRVREARFVRGPGGAGEGQTGAGVLLTRMQAGVSCEGIGQVDGRYEPQVCGRAHAPEQPDEPAGGQGPRIGNPQVDEVGAGRAWRQRQGDDAARADVRRCDRMGSANRRDQGRRGRLPESLQDRRGQPRVDDCRGNRRAFSRRPGSPGTGPEETGVLGVAWVESVSVHQPSDRSGFGGLCPDGHVYNIEVEGNHNYFAAGILVHNCHRAAADTYLACVAHYRQNPNLHVLGVTATGDRGDGEGLGCVFESVAYRYELPQAVKDGWLVPVRQRSVTVEGLDFSKCRTTAGDLNQGDLAAVMEFEAMLHPVAHATLELAAGLSPGSLSAIKDLPDRMARIGGLLSGRRVRRTLVFAVSVIHAERLAEIFNRWIDGAANMVCGETDPERRKQLLADYSAGKYPILVNVGIATEGFDEPGIEVVVMARPTKSRSLFAQMLGRGTRPIDDIAHHLGELPDAASRQQAIESSAKPFVEILDFVGNSGRHKLVSAADILGSGHDESVIDRAREIAAEEDIDLTSAMEQAEAEQEQAQEAERLFSELAQLEAEAAEEAVRRQAEAARRLGLVATTNYTVQDVAEGDISPERDSGMRRGGATDKQIAFLVSLGVRRETASGYSKRQAGAVIESLKAQRCTTGQAGMLRRHGYSPQQIQSMNFAQASEAIDQARRGREYAA